MNLYLNGVPVWLRLLSHLYLIATFISQNHIVLIFLYSSSLLSSNRKCHWDQILFILVQLTCFNPNPAFQFSALLL